jgi:hypothetical protein
MEDTYNTAYDHKVLKAFSVEKLARMLGWWNDSSGRTPVSQV